VRVCGLDSPGSGWRSVLETSEHSSEPSGSIKGEEYLD